MIVPMKKFLLVVLDKDRNTAPRELRSLGVLHLKELEGRGEPFQAIEREKARAESAYGQLLSSSKKKKAKFPETGKLPREEEQKARLLVDRVTGLVEELGKARDRSTALAREVDRAKSWGDFSAAQVSEIEKAFGGSVRLFEVPSKEFSSIPKEIEFIRLVAPKGLVRVACIERGGQASRDLGYSFKQYTPPEDTISRMKAEIAEAGKYILDINRELSAISGELGLVASYISALDSDLTLERLGSGMSGVEELAYLEGFIPGRDGEKFSRMVADRGWALAFAEPDREEMPPTLVENSPAVRIINPIFEFLGTVPNYFEYEISFWFLIFLTVFAAMIFGDGGYGTIITLSALLSILLSKRKGRKASDAQILFTVIGATTVLWGALTGSWFGISFDHLPSLLRGVSLPWINGQQADSENNVKAVCFAIGLVQLAIAHIKNIKRDFPDLKFLSQVGSLLLLAGMFNASLNLVVDAKRFPIGTWAILSIGIGFAMNFIFGNWTGRLGSSAVESLKGIIPLFLGTVSIFADIVSYIRLWAVGLAGLAISQTVNGMAGGILGGGVSGYIVGFIIKLLVASVLLLVSHSLNFILTILSIIVHGIRLNMLEFSGHLGMEWSGYKYNPLREKGIPPAPMQ